MISAARLRDEAKQRGIDLQFYGVSATLEALDQSGGFCPIGFLQTNSTPETTWLTPDAELLVWREERNFEPWKRHGWYFADQPEIVNVSERFSPWQLLYLDAAIATRESLISTRELAASADAEIVAKRRLGAQARLKTLDEEWRPLVKLLVSLQPRLWSYRKQAATYLYVPEKDGRLTRVDPLGLSAMTFDPGPSAGQVRAVARCTCATPLLAR